MSNITDAQLLSVYNAQGGVEPNSINPTPPGGANIVESPTTATPFQVSTARNADLYITINTAAALAIAIGPTSACAVPVVASETAALGLCSVFVPAGWYVNLTGTMADLTVTAVLR